MIDMSADEVNDLLRGNSSIRPMPPCNVMQLIEEACGKLKTGLQAGKTTLAHPPGCVWAASLLSWASKQNIPLCRWHRRLSQAVVYDASIWDVSCKPHRRHMIPLFLWHMALCIAGASMTEQACTDTSKWDRKQLACLLTALHREAERCADHQR